MKNNRILSLLVSLVIITLSMAGCIEINDKTDNEKVEPYVKATDSFTLNQSKTINLDDLSYEINITDIDPSKVTLIMKLNSDELRLVAFLGISKEIDFDYDGRNELKLNVTEINQFSATIEFTAISSTSQFIYILDDTGILVKVPKKIDKIISLAASLTEILFELEQGDKIVGRDSGSNYPEEAKNIEVVSSYEGIDIEKILAAEPDIIFIDKTLDMTESNYNKLIENDQTVFRLYPQKLSDVIENIKLIGKVVGKESLASDVSSGLETRINKVKTRGESLGEQERPIVLYVIYYDGTSSPWVGSTSTISGDLIKTAGGLVAVEDATGFSIQITIEQLIGLDPDIILTSQDDTWPTPSKDAILNDEVLSNVKALKSGQVYDVNADLVDRPGPRMVDGLELISGFIMLK